MAFYPPKGYLATSSKLLQKVPFIPVLYGFLEGGDQYRPVEYWGGFTGSKTFDILVNDQIIATENISGKADGQFIDVQYIIPDEISLINSKIKVDFIPHLGHRAGPVFNVRTIKR